MQSKEKLNVENGTDVTIVTFEEENILEDQQIRKLERTCCRWFATTSRRSSC